MTSSVSIAVLVFCGSLLLSIIASAVLAERLDQVGNRFSLPAGLVGLVTAFGADAPEITSAVTALVGGQHDFGRGVIFGSNIFNIAMLLGLSAVIAGRVVIGRANLLLNAAVSLGMTLIAAGETVGWLGSMAAGIAFAAILAPYLTLSSLPPRHVSRLPVPQALSGWLRNATMAAERDEAPDPGDRPMTWTDGLSIVPLLAVIIATSIGMVRTAVFLGDEWHVRQVVVGTFVVATLTGIPNLIAAIRLAVKRRGAALSSEAFNSNTLNILVGIYLPTLFFSMSAPSAEAVLAISWLIGMTVAALVLGLLRSGFGRWSGALLLAAYAGFAALVIL